MYLAPLPLNHDVHRPRCRQIRHQRHDEANGYAPTKPWFAIGGIDENNLDQVLSAGAKRIVVVRAITDAIDPERAAAMLRSRLN